MSNGRRHKSGGLPTDGPGGDRLSSFKLGLARSDTRPPALAPAPPDPPVGLGSLEIQGHPDPDLSPRGGTAARSFTPDLARIGPRFE